MRVGFQELLEALGGDEQVKAFLGSPLDHVHFTYVYLHSTYLHGRLGHNLQVISWGGVAIGINAIGYREVLGNSLEEGFAYAVATARPRPSGVSFWARSSPKAQWERGLTGTRLVGTQLLEHQEEWQPSRS